MTDVICIMHMILDGVKVGYMMTTVLALLVSLLLIPTLLSLRWSTDRPARLSFQHTHLPPFALQQAHALVHPVRRHQVAHHQQVEFFAKRQEMGEERVEVRLDGEMQDLLKVRVVQVGKDPEEVFVDVLGGIGKGCGEVPACRVSWESGIRKVPRTKEYGQTGKEQVRGEARSRHPPDFVGKTDSSSSNRWSHDSTKSMYVGAGRETSFCVWSGQRKLILFIVNSA